MNKYLYDISIVIPVYNVEEYIDECIQSILKQNYPIEKIQIVLVDDGSLDNSFDKCKKYEKKYSNINLLFQKNKGVSTARNKGIQISEGKYIMLLDSDDTISSNAVKELVAFFEKNYNEVDIVTYPILFNKNGKIEKNSRYDEYDKGSGIYDIEQYVYLNQSTINIVFKNEFENTNLFDADMKLSEDQDFCTRLIMKKHKIGFVKNAIYYYRRHGNGASQSINNPYYCFEDIMRYNEDILNRYKVDGKIPKYIQSLVINTIKWRFTSDQLFPYHYTGQDFKYAVDRIRNMIKCIEPEVLMNIRGLSYFYKIALLKFSGRNIELKFENDISIYCDDIKIYSADSYNGYISKLKINGTDLNINGQIFNPALNKIDNVFIDFYYIDGSKKTKRISLFEANDTYNLVDKEKNRTYGFDFSFDIKKVKKFKIYEKINNKNIDITFRFRRFASNNFYLNGYNVLYSAKKSCFRIRRGVINKIKSHLRKGSTCFKKKPKSLLFRIASYMWFKKNKIWLYTDRGDTLDNAFVQFKHDFEMNDSVKRYYICKKNKIDINNEFSKKEKKFIIEQDSFKHKILYLISDKIITSFIDLQVYCPLGAIYYYNDIIHYDLIYLQHGILHANLRKMYSKEFTQIDKFVVSTNFEIDNLINNYHYNKSDLLLTGMPRMNTKSSSAKLKNNKILYAPSWRKYLIGALINNKRNLREKEFLASDFYKEEYSFLHSAFLRELLEKENYTLEFKLHPIFKQYSKFFELDDLERVSLSFSETKIEEYNIFITDFSSFQFDFVKLRRPIIYFVPDMKEFKAGLHTYRELDLKYEDAFGNLCLTGNDLLKELERIIRNKSKVDKKYLNRMNKFFIDIDNPCKKIYESISK